jgi:hypothetical protein
MSYLASLPFGLMLVLGIIAPPATPSAVTTSTGTVASTPDTTAADPSTVNVRSRLTDRYAPLPETLDQAGLLEGFEGVSRSVDQCVSRQLKLDGEFSSGKVEVNLTVGPDWKVSRLRLPRPVRQTTFGACMQAHSSRWRFPQFTGKPVKASKRFVVR